MLTTFVATSACMQQLHALSSCACMRRLHARSGYVCMHSAAACMHWLCMHAAAACTQQLGQFTWKGPDAMLGSVCGKPELVLGLRAAATSCCCRLPRLRGHQMSVLQERAKSMQLAGVH